MKSFQDLTFSTRIQDGIPRDNQRDQKRKMLDRQKNLSKFLLDFMRSFQDLTFSIIIQDGIPRDDQRDKKGKCLTGRKTLASFYWIYEVLWGFHFFHKNPGWDPKGQPKGPKRKMLDR